jgi:hypothetical protein
MENSVETGLKEASPPNTNQKQRVWIRVQASRPDGSVAPWGDSEHEVNLSPLASFQLRFKIACAVKEARERQKIDDAAARRLRSRKVR